MANIKDSTLIIVIQALEAEMKRFRAIAHKDLVAADEIFYDDMSRAALDLKAAYAAAAQDDAALPPYSKLIGPRS